MIFITQCPKCHTRFNVNSDQLSKAGGRVRCGNCDLVFNATKSLEEATLDSTATKETQSKGSFITKDSSNASLITKNNLSEKDNISKQKPFIAPKLIESVQSNVFPSLFHMRQSEDLNRENSRRLGPRPPRAQQQSTRKLVKQMNALNDEQLTKPKRRSYLSEEGELSAELFGERKQINKSTEKDSYIKEHFRKENKKQNSFINKICVLLSFLGILLIISQLVLMNRVYVATSFPQAMPVIKFACKIIKCSIPLPSNISQIRTEFSEMVKIPEYDSLWQINAVLKNNAYYAQNYPFLELELKDSSGKLLVSRQLKPKEYLKPLDFKQNQLNANSAVKINLHLDVKDLPVKSYNIIWFYPEKI